MSGSDERRGGHPGHAERVGTGARVVRARARGRLRGVRTRGQEIGEKEGERRKEKKRRKEKERREKKRGKKKKRGVRQDSRRAVAHGRQAAERRGMGRRRGKRERERARFGRRKREKKRWNDDCDGENFLVRVK